MANGANSVFVEDGIIFDDPVTMMARANAAAAGCDYVEGVFPFLTPPNSAGIPEGVQVDWWDPNAPSPANGAGMGIPWNMLPHPAGGTFHEQGLILNENMSAEKARGNIDLCMDYIYPRACVALDLPCRSFFVSNTEELLPSALATVTPNPASDFINIEADDVIQSIELLDMQGRLVKKVTNLSVQTYRLDILDSLTGMHTLNIRFEEGVVAKKIILN